MLQKDKNGNETGLTLKRNVQKEPPKKFYLKGEFSNQSMMSIEQLKCNSINHFQKKKFPKNCKIILSRNFSCAIVWWALHDCFLSIQFISCRGLISMAVNLCYHRKDASPTINGQEFVSYCTVVLKKG